MTDQIIDIEATVISVEPFVNPSIDPIDEIFKQLEELNSKVTDKDNGNWVNIPNYGICWKPNVNTTETSLGVPSPSSPPPALEGLVQWGNQLDFNSIPENSVLAIKLNVSNPNRVQMMQRSIAKHILEPHIDILKEKRVCILFMQTDDDISMLTEEAMNKAGWEKKEKSRIIVL